MDKTRTYYDILQISADAEPEMITAAYRTLMSTMGKHPDRGGDTDEAAEINLAYETLSDASRRARYDLLVKLDQHKQVPAVASGPERRRVPRHDIAATISYCFDHDSQWHTARVKDVSTLGIRFQSHEPIEQGRHLVIAPPNLAACALHGTVRWVRMFHPTVFERVYEAGIEFADQIVDIDLRMKT